MATRGKAWSKARAACPRPEGLLLLTQLHANRQGDALAYAKSIRAWLEANDGRPRVPRRAVTDRDGVPSLR